MHQTAINQCKETVFWWINQQKGKLSEPHSRRKKTKKKNLSNFPKFELYYTNFYYSALQWKKGIKCKFTFFLTHCTHNVQCAYTKLDHTISTFILSCSHASCPLPIFKLFSLPITRIVYLLHAIPWHSLATNEKQTLFKKVFLFCQQILKWRNQNNNNNNITNSKRS